MPTSARLYIDNIEVYARYMSALPVSVAVLDTHMYYLAYNKAWVKQYGLEAADKKNEILGEDHYVFFPEIKKTRKDWRENHEKILAGATLEKQADSFIQQDGRTHFLHWRSFPFYNKDDSIAGIVIITESVTEHVTLQRFYDLSLDMLCTAGLDGFFKQVNPAFMRTLGYVEKTLLSRSFLSFLHPDDVAETERVMGPALEGKAVEKFENRYRCKNGEYRWFQWNARFDKETQLIYAVARDVTATKQDKLEIAKQNYLLAAINVLQEQYVSGQDVRTVFSRALDDLLVLASSGYGFIGEIREGETGRYLKTFAITNITWSKETNEPYKQNVPEGLEFHNLYSLFGYTIRTGKQVISNNPMHDKKRGALPKGHPDLNNYLGLPILGSSGVIGMVGLANCPNGYDQKIVDYLAPFLKSLGTIIEAYSNTKALKLSQERNYERIIESSLDGICVGNYEGVLVDVNPAYCNMLGRTKEALLRINVLDRIHPDYRHNHKEFMRQLKENGQVKIETADLHKDGHAVPIDVLGMPFHYKGQDVIITFVRDISERKKAEALLAENQEELAHVTRLSTVGEMATSIAHELNQPLAAIINYMSGCLRRVKSRDYDEEKLCGAMEKASRQAERAAKIIQRLRSFVSKNDTPKVKSNLNEEIENVKILLEPEAKKHGVMVKIYPGKKIPSIYIDRIQIEQVLVNLLKNAIEAVAPLSKEKRVVEVQACYQQKKINIAVYDCGPGVPAADKDKLFEPFFSTKKQGMGMGLAISRTIVEQHGGELWMDKQCVCAEHEDIQNRTCFTVCLPVSL
jgi:two-component system NtrC family sensor kinase